MLDLFKKNKFLFLFLFLILLSSIYLNLNKNNHILKFSEIVTSVMAGTEPIVINDKIVSDVCEHYIETSYVTHYKNISEKVCTPPNEINLTEQCTNIKETVTDYIEEIKTIKCRSNGFVNISGEIIGYKDFFCRIEGNEIVCISEKEGGRWNTCKKDGSVTCWKKDLITNKETFKNSLKTRLEPTTMAVAE